MILEPRDPFTDPSHPVELCQCGNLLSSSDWGDCMECRIDRAEIRKIPLWPLWLAVIILAMGSALLIPLIYVTWKIVFGG